MLRHQRSHSRLPGMVMSIILVSQLLGCNSGDTSNGDSSSANLTSDAVVNVDLNGSVGDGPIIGAKVAIYSVGGGLITSVLSDVTASYDLKVKARGYDYPLLLKVTGGTDLVTGNEPDFELLSVAMNPSEKSININPFSTLIVKMAQSMAGGVDAANISAARAIVTNSFTFGLDPSVISDPITAQITESNAANIVKASEVLGEMVRRTRDAMLAAGTVVSGDAVMTAIAADLTDGDLNGIGDGVVNPAISATAKVVSAQVLVEALGNSLMVGGGPATRIIDDSIVYTRPGVSTSQLTGSVRITSDMLRQTQIALSAVQVLDSSAAVQDIVSSVADISPNALPAEVLTVLPVDASAGLAQAVTLTPYASTADIANINQVVSYTGSVDTTTGGAGTGGTAGSDTGTVVNGSLPSDGSMIVDNSGAGFSTVGNWISSTDIAGYYGSDYQYSNSGDGSSEATWRFDIANAGNYAVNARWSAYPNRATDAPYTIYNNGSLVAQVVKNQQINGGQFNPLGSYHLAAGTLEVVLNNKASGYVIADAVQVAGTDTTSGGTTNGGTTGTDSTGGTISGGTTGTGSTSSSTTSNGTTGTDSTGGTASGDTTVPGTPDPVQTGSITLQWAAPVSRTDGTPLSLADIDGYHIYYGVSSQTYPNLIDVSDGTAQSAVITDIPVGTYYVVMTTYDVSGLESAYSSMVIKTVP